MYVKYNLWANKTIVEFLNAQDNSILDKEVVSSFTSIRETIFHIVNAQHIWIERMRGNSPTDWPSKTLNIEHATSELILSSQSWVEFLADQPDTFYLAICSFSTLDGTVYKETNGNIIMHCMNHSTFHRGQLITMFRAAGVTDKLPRTDLIAYLREMEK